MITVETDTLFPQIPTSVHDSNVPIEATVNDDTVSAESSGQVLHEEPRIVVEECHDDSIAREADKVNHSDLTSSMGSVHTNGDEPHRKESSHLVESCVESELSISIVRTNQLIIVAACNCYNCRLIPLKWPRRKTFRQRADQPFMMRSHRKNSVDPGWESNER